MCLFSDLHSFPLQDTPKKDEKPGAANQGTGSEVAAGKGGASGKKEENKLGKKRKIREPADPIKSNPTNWNYIWDAIRKIIAGFNLDSIWILLEIQLEFTQDSLGI